jgi:hypothetical protein
MMAAFQGDIRTSRWQLTLVAHSEKNPGSVATRHF